jgi:hypothetical protein
MPLPRSAPSYTGAVEQEAGPATEQSFGVAPYLRDPRILKVREETTAVRANQLR